MTDTSDLFQELAKRYKVAKKFIKAFKKRASRFGKQLNEKRNKV